MVVYIDESGSFVIPQDRRPSISCVGALVARESGSDSLANDFAALKKTWGLEEEEAKGSRLGEEQVFQVISLLLDHHCKFITCCTDMSAYQKGQLEAYRDRQAQGFIVNLTERHSPQLREQMANLKREFGKLPYQLYVQSRILTELLIRIIQESSVLFARVDPPELAAFRWIIDAKDTTKTSYEKCWEIIVGGLIQSFLLINPLVAVKGGDYSHMFRNFIAHDQVWPSHLPVPNLDPADAGPIFDLGKILDEDMSFKDSKNCEGLQLVDITTNAFRRATMGRLRYSGWCRLGELMMRLKGDAIGMFQLSHDGRVFNKPLPTDFWRRLQRMESKAKLVVDC